MHNGFDVDAINAALRDAENGASLRGASTITQQVAKNLFLWPGRSFVRKGLEAWLTLLIELMWDKQRILEMYLNIAQFSARTFGVEAASQQFFQISAQDLTAEEAALLAAVLPGPELYSVERPFLGSARPPELDSHPDESAWWHSLSSAAARWFVICLLASVLFYCRIY